MAELYKAGIIRMLDENGVYQPILAIKGEQGPVASEEVIRRVTSEEVAKVVAEAPEDFNTLKEIADWINTHEDDASAMNSAIQANTSNIATNTSNISTLTGRVNNLTTIISGTLTSGQTSIELTDSRITESSIIDAYINIGSNTETEPISYKTIKVENGKVTMTFDEMEADITVGIKVV